jgi:hypothetical protein
MGRKSIHKKPMTPAQRQRRRRAKVTRRLISTGDALEKAERRKCRLAKVGKQMIPAPPGITIWREVAINTPDGEAKIWTPVTQPAATVTLQQLSDSEIDGFKTCSRMSKNAALAFGRRSGRLRTLRSRSCLPVAPSGTWCGWICSPARHGPAGTFGAMKSASASVRADARSNRERKTQRTLRESA